MLNLLRKTLAAGGTRLRVYDTFLRKAWKDRLMPHNTQLVAGHFKSNLAGQHDVQLLLGPSQRKTAGPQRRRF